MDNMHRLGRAVAIVAVTMMGASPDDGLDDRIYESLRANDNHVAAELIKQHLETHPADAVMLYNAACVQCRLGALDRGAAYFIKAVKSGFTDISHARRDPDLRVLREHAVFRAIVDARAAADEMLARRRMEGWRRRFGDRGYRYEVDTPHRLLYVSALDDARHAEVVEMLGRQADQMQETLFPGPRDHVLIVIPNAEDARTLITRRHVAGLYNHRRRELVTLGDPRAMRHELAHAAHQGHMDAVGQEHPLWIQEGIASLYEDYRFDDDDAIHFLPNDRTPQMKTLAVNGWLMPWSELASLRPSSLDDEAYRVYPELRSIFRFIAERGLLESWYHAYVAGFDDDPSGLAAIESTFGQPLEAVEAAWRHWLNGQG